MASAPAAVAAGLQLPSHLHHGPSKAKPAKEILSAPVSVGRCQHDAGTATLPKPCERRRHQRGSDAGATTRLHDCHVMDETGLWAQIAPGGRLDRGIEVTEHLVIPFGNEHRCILDIKLAREKIGIALLPGSVWRQEPSLIELVVGLEQDGPQRTKNQQITLRRRPYDRTHKISSRSRWHRAIESLRMSDCLFCKIVSGQIPADIVHQDDALVGFRDISPKAPLHVLIVPRRHIATLNDLIADDDALVGSMARLAAAVAKEHGYDQGGFRTVFNCNADTGQTVFHIHMHLLAGRPLSWPPG